MGDQTTTPTPTGVFARLGSWCATNARAVLAIWAVVVIAAAVTAPRLDSRLTHGGFEITGSDSHRVPQLTRSEFPAEYASGLTAVIELTDAGDGAGLLQRAEERVRAAAKRYPQLVRGIDPMRVAPGDRMGAVLIGLRSGLDEVLRHVDPLLDELAAIRGEGVVVRVTGGAAVFRDFDAVNAQDLRRSELIQGPLVLLILLLVMGSLIAAGLPLVAGAAAMVVTLGGLWAVSHGLDMTIYVKNIVPLIGVGVCVDYSLFMVTRFREELAAGRATAQAVAATSATAGRAVFFSGLTVIVALAGMAWVRVPIFSSFAIGATSVVAAAVVAALTLVPALLALLGQRLSPSRMRRSPLDLRSANRLESWATRVMNRPVASLVGATVLLGLLAAPVTVIKLGSSGSSTIPDTMPSIRASLAITEVAGPGAVAPIRVVVDGGGAAPDDGVIARVRQAVQQTAGVFAVTRARPSADGTLSLFDVVSNFHEDDVRSRELVAKLREAVLPPAIDRAPVRAYVGGAPAQNHDFVQTVSQRFPVVIALVMSLTFLVLVILFRSLLLPLKAVVLTLISALAAYGVLVAVFQWGWLAGLLGFEPLGHVTAWVPPLLFCLLFGLSMDYEVFLITRIRERMLQTGDERAAIAWGVGRSGRIITAAAAIMVVVFLSFLTNRLIPVKEAALGMAAAVLIDATIVRVVMVPAFMAIAGKWNWWLPRWLDRLLPSSSTA